MRIGNSYCLPISVFLIIFAMMLVASAAGRQSSAFEFDPDYPIGTPPIQGGTGYVSETATGWHNAQDWNEYNSDYNGYHPGEDWNYGTGTDDVGKPVYAIAGGIVADTRENVFKSGGYGGGIVIEHTLPTGEKIYSVYIHIDISSGLKKGDFVGQGDRIGTIADTTSVPSHLHFEIRNKSVDPNDWYPNDNGLGYYASEEDLRKDGLIDPSDFIDYHRSTTTAPKYKADPEKARQEWATASWINANGGPGQACSVDVDGTPFSSSGSSSSEDSGSVDNIVNIEVSPHDPPDLPCI